MDPVTALLATGGAARTGALRTRGVSSRRLAAAVAAGPVVRHAPGLYALPACSPSEFARAAVDGALSCTDAARALGLSVLWPGTFVHVLAARGSRRTWPRTVVHRLAPPRVEPVALDLPAALRSTARCLPARWAVSLVDEALRTGRCTSAELHARCAPGDRAWRAVLALSDGRAGSGIESLARVELVEALRSSGLTVEVQVGLRAVGTVDLLVDGWLVVELDGLAFHADRASYREDRRRTQVLTRHGYSWLRFTYEDVIRSRGDLAEQVLQTWSRGRAPGFRSLRAP